MDYQLKQPAKTCSVTGEPLAPGETVYSAVLEQNGRFHRLEFSEQAWDGPPEDAVGYWRHIVPDEQRPATKPLDPDSLLQYFEQLLEDANFARQKLAYVLALLLIQKRRLTLDGTRDDGDLSYLQLTGSQGEGPYEVREFELSVAERDELQQAVQAFLWEG